MKKVIFLILLFVICFSVSALGEEYVRIGLKYNKNVISECTVSGYDGGMLIVNAGNANVLNQTVSEVKVSFLDNTIIVSDMSDTVTHCMLSDTLAYVEIGSSNGIVCFNDKAYRGTLIFTVSSGGIQVVNYVDIEEYLRSVVPSEMPAGWNIEALKAQAVCARNYTMINKGKFKSYGFDLDDSTASQVYKGVSTENPQSDLAVEQTRGIILLYEDKPASLFYYSSSGGYTEDVKNVWGGTTFPYLISVPDPYDIRTQWSVRYTFPELKTKLLSLGIDIGDVKKFEVTKRTESGRAAEVVITGTNGSYTATRDKTRNILGFKSSMYFVYSGGENIGSEYSVLTSKGLEKRKINSGIMTSEGLMNLPYEVVPENEVIFEGYGFGHGIGLSQYGAKGFADNGYTYDKILLHYFPGTVLGKY